nr:immunoglobulin heavy chain junction region [Mus musculus]
CARPSHYTGYFDYW